MKKIILIGVSVAILVLFGIVLIVGRGNQPQHPFIYSDSSKSDLYTHIDKEGLLEDIDYFLGLIDKAHGDPYRLISKQVLTEKTAELKNHIRLLQADKIPLIDCYYYLQECAAFIQDEHTKVRFNDSWNKYIEERFPLIIRIFEKKAFVVKDLSQAGIPQYAQLIRIADEPVEEIMSKTWKFMNVTLPHYKRQIAERFFWTFLQTYFELKPPWKITYIYGDKEKTVEVSGISPEEFSEKTKQEILYSESAFTVNGETIPVLEIPKFWYPDKPAYEKFMDEFFNKHKDKSYLVIDLRRNPGGDGRWGYFVLDYLTDSPYMLHKRFDFKISETFTAVAWHYQHYDYYRRKIPRLLWWLPLYKIMGGNYWLDFAAKAEIGEYAEEHDVYRNPDPNKVKFKGEAYLLVSHYTNSAAVVFSAIFKHKQLGTLVGRETGGRETFSSDPISVEMPNSTLQVVIPVAILALPGNNPDRGVLPDVKVEYTAEDFAKQRDKDLEKVKELIKKELEAK